MKKFFSIALFSALALLSVPVMSAQSTTPPDAIKVGQQFTLTVTADGTTPFTYQWKKNGTNIAGATTNPYVVANAQLAAAGTYNVTVSNSAGSTTSTNNMTIVMLGAPVFTVQPGNASLAVGAPLNLSVTAIGNPTPTFQWFKGATAIAGATSATYNIAAVATTDAGSYTCVATSTIGTVSNSTTSAAAVVAVNVAPPVITGITITVQ